MKSAAGEPRIDISWNPVTGCTKISAGCVNCYAAAFSLRLRAMGQPAYSEGFALTLHPHKLGLPLRWRKPRTVFVCSMSDLFHEDVPDEYIEAVFETMAAAPQHRYLVLTKRSARLAELSAELSWPPQVWAGVTVENAAMMGRIGDLRSTPAQHRWLCAEPLLGPLAGLEVNGLDWVVLGGESGPGTRPMEVEWARGVRDVCRVAGVPFYLKQLGGWPRRRGGAEALLDGRRWTQSPPDTDGFGQPLTLPGS